MSSGPETDDENDLEIIQEGEIVEENDEVEIVENQVETNDAETQNDEDAENQDKKVVKPKRVIKNPQPKLNEQTLKGPRGLAAIEGCFERVKFKGRGHEEQDLNVLMKTYEYWCHRLFPKFPFDDCIARLEKLGTKKATLTQIKRIRMDINLEEDERVLSDEGENDTAGFVDTLDTQFDELLPNTNQTTSQMISDEQLERMRQNRERAEQLRQERLRKIREKAQSSLGESNHLANTQISAISTTSQFDEPVAGCSNDRNVDYEQERSDILTEGTSGNKNVEDEEDNIDNILTSINSEENKNNSPKRKRRVIESDSEDDLVGGTSSQNLEGDKANEEEDGSTDNIATTSRRNDQQDEDDIDNILSQINAEENTDEATNESDIAKEVESGSMNNVEDKNNEEDSNNENDLREGQNKVGIEDPGAVKGDMEVEDDIDNILSQINAEEDNLESRKDVIATNTDEGVTIKKLGSDTAEEAENATVNSTNNQNDVAEGQDDIGIEDAAAGGDMEVEEDIDNILSQINTEENNLKSTKTITDSSSESESTNTVGVAKIKQIESDTVQKVQNEKINNVEDTEEDMEDEDIDNILISINTEENDPKKLVTENDSELVKEGCTYDTETIGNSINQSLPTAEMENNRGNNKVSETEGNEKNISESILNANINQNGINDFSGKSNLHNLEDQQQTVESDKENYLDGINASDNSLA